MTVTSAPIGSTGQSLDGFAVAANVPDAFRESVVITDPSDPTAVLSLVSTQPIQQYGVPVWMLGTPGVTVAGTTQALILGTTSVFVVSSVPNVIAGTTQVFGQVSSFPTGVASSFVTNQLTTTNVNVISTVPHTIAGTSQVFGSVSTQIVSSIPLLVAQSTSPWVVSSAPIALTGTSQVFGTVSTFPTGVTSSFTVNNVSTYPTVNVTNVPAVNITSSIPQFVAQSTTPWVVNGSTQIVSSIPFFVSQSSAPWSVIDTPSTTGGVSSVVISLAATLNTTVIKGSPGQVYGMYGSNLGSSQVFIRLYNQSTAALTIASTGVPLLNMGMAISTNSYLPIDLGVPFSAGITMLTQQQPYTASSSVSPTASTATVTILFK